MALCMLLLLPPASRASPITSLYSHICMEPSWGRRRSDFGASAAVEDGGARATGSLKLLLAACSLSSANIVFTISAFGSQRLAPSCNFHAGLFTWRYRACVVPEGAIKPPSLRLAVAFTTGAWNGRKAQNTLPLRLRRRYRDVVAFLTRLYS